MTEKIEDNEHEEMTDEEVTEMRAAAYRLLVPSILSQCQGVHPQVAIAACISAGASVCVDSIGDMAQAQKFFATCSSDAYAKFPAAYEQKAKLDGADTGGESQSEN
jgi:hypothetical protein